MAVALLAPLAMAMGMPFAIGMRAAAARPGTPTAFLWGINGAASVCASVFGVVIAMIFGISAAFWAGGLAYAVAIASMAVLTGRPAVPESAMPLDGEPDRPTDGDRDPAGIGVARLRGAGQAS